MLIRLVPESTDRSESLQIDFCTRECLHFFKSVLLVTSQTMQQPCLMLSRKGNLLYESDAITTPARSPALARRV